MSIDFSLSIEKKLQSSESENKSAFLVGVESENLAETESSGFVGFCRCVSIRFSVSSVSFPSDS